MNNKLYLIEFMLDDRKTSYQIPSDNEYNALVRLGQIFGDKPNRDERKIEIISIRCTNLYS